MSVRVTTPSADFGEQRVNLVEGGDEWFTATAGQYNVVLDVYAKGVKVATFLHWDTVTLVDDPEVPENG